MTLVKHLGDDLRVPPATDQGGTVSASLVSDLRPRRQGDRACQTPGEWPGSLRASVASAGPRFRRYSFAPSPRRPSSHSPELHLHTQGGRHVEEAKLAGYALQLPGRPLVSGRRQVA